MRKTTPGRCGRRRTVRRRPAIITAAWCGAAAVLATGAGCQQALFPENAPRTQFETYSILRQEYVPTEQPDVFGNPRPALRARLQR